MGHILSNKSCIVYVHIQALIQASKRFLELLFQAIKVMFALK